MNSIKVLNIVTAKTWGGGEQYVYDTAKAMRSKNIDVYIAVDKDNTMFQKKFSEVASVIPVNLYKCVGLKTFVTLKRFMPKNHINILNVHSGRSMLLWILLKMVTGVKLVMFKHNAVSAKQDLYHCWERDKIDAFVCVSQLVYNLQTSSLTEVHKHKFNMIYNGIDTNKYQKFNYRNKITKKDFVIGYAGRITKNKGIDILLIAFRNLVFKYPELKLLIAGSDEKGCLSEVIKFINDNKLEDKVKYCGHIDNMESFYERLDIFVLPSVVKEAFGLTLCEAMYCGVVVITTDSGAQKEIIANNIDGYIAKTGDVEDLEKMIEKVYLGYNEQSVVIESAKRKVFNKFSIDICVDRLINMYYKLLA